MSTAIKSQVMGLEDLKSSELQNKKVLVRVDFNVPTENGKITDDTRLRAAIPTIECLNKNNSIVILCSHFGRPKGQKNPKYTLEPVAKKLSELLKKKVTFINDCIGDSVKAQIYQMKGGEICLLENLRFYGEEEANDAAFSKKLADLADLYVNDAFGAAHRAHASTAGVTQYINRCVAGFLMEKEVRELGSLIDNPERPFLSIVGGSKVSTKLDVLKSLIEKSDVVLVGGGMAYTFDKARGGTIGGSLCEDDKIQTALEIIEFAKQRGTALIFPSDSLCVKNLSDPEDKPVVRNAGEIEEGLSGCDIGPKTIENFKRQISLAKTVLWNGPVGIFEDSRFESGSKGISEGLVDLQKRGGRTVIGGGDSAAAVAKFGYKDEDFGHISTGGGASLEFLSGQILPGVNVLNKKN